MQMWNSDCVHFEFQWQELFVTTRTELWPCQMKYFMVYIPFDSKIIKFIKVIKLNYYYARFIIFQKIEFNTSPLFT